MTQESLIGGRSDPPVDRNRENKMNTDKKTFTVTDGKGNAVECEMLFTFKNDNTNYIIYTDNTKDAEGNTKVLASILDTNEKRLLPIETEEEWDVIGCLLEKLTSKRENR